MTERHPNFCIIKAPDNSSRAAGAWGVRPTIFLAGSIDMGAAVNWQTQVEEALQDYAVAILNPRRDDFDPTMEQRADNPAFAEQVNWEQDAIRTADFILFYFDPAGKAPITLMELGIVTEMFRQGDGPWPYVCCPDGYWRKGNVDIVCQRAGIKQAGDLAALIQLMRDHLDSWETDCTRDW
jgi:hypothetical protein